MNQLLLTILFVTLTGLTACDNKETCERAPDSVCVTVINASGQNIQTIKLIHEKGMFESGQIVKDDKTCISFTSPGENAFNLTAILSNGDSITSRQEYSEGGYQFIGTVTNTKIEIRHNDTY